jgi:hypothetical protein
VMAAPETKSLNDIIILEITVPQVEYFFMWNC